MRGTWLALVLASCGGRLECGPGTYEDDGLCLPVEDTDTPSETGTPTMPTATTASTAETAQPTGETGTETAHTGLGTGDTGGTGGDLPNLIIGAITPSPGYTYGGGYVIVDFQIDNQGPGDSPGTDIDFRMSDDAVFDVTDDFMCSASIGNLGGYDTTLGVAYCFAPYLAPGFYHLVARVDVSALVPESNELDNDASVPFNVTP